MVLLVSGSLPALPHRVHILRRLAPLPFVEVSHFSASLIGTALLLLAPGLYRRLDGAFLIARALLIAGALFSLGKGLDFEEAGILLLLAGLLQWSRGAFYRRTALTSEPVSPRWVLMILLAFGLSLWIGFFAYKHVEYSSDLWWHFAFRANAARFLRASLGAAILLLGWAVWRLLAPGRVAAAPETLPPAVAAAALAATQRSEAMLAFTGDKKFLVSHAGDAFLMYQVRGRSWIAMGDPVGPYEAWPELLWALRARADAAQGQLLLYQITPDLLPLAIEMGLQIVKYGEDAHVDLADFRLEGGDMRRLRHCVRRAEREGARFQIVPAAALPAIWSELKSVSDEWLAARNQAEKGFSLGRFERDYLVALRFRDRPRLGGADRRVRQYLGDSRSLRAFGGSHALPRDPALRRDGSAVRAIDAVGTGAELSPLLARPGAACGDRGTAAVAGLGEGGRVHLPPRRAALRLRGAEGL